MIERVQCPFCLKRVRLKSGPGDTLVMYVHTIGNGVTLRRCRGSDQTKEAAYDLKRRGSIENLSGRPDSIEPEDIF